MISDGKIVGQGTPEQMDRAESSWVRQFMQGLPDGPVPFHYPGADYIDDLLASEER